MQDIGVVSFQTTYSNALYLNYVSRLANKIIVILSKESVNSYDDLYQQALQIPWDSYFTVQNTFVVHSSLIFSKMDHTAFAAVRIKDAIADYFRNQHKERPSVNKGEPDIYIEARVYKNESWIGINLSGEPLFKRGYKREVNPAPLKETLAAGLVELAEIKQYKKIIDGMTGSGTIIIEAALKYLNIPGGYYRNNFGFQKLKNFNSTSFLEMRQKENKKIFKTPPLSFLACDHTPKFLESCKHNIHQAKLDNFIEVKKQDFFNPVIDMTHSLILLNPPYGERMKGAVNLNEFYKKMGDTLKKFCKGSTAYIFTEHAEPIKHIGLRSSKRIILYNGKIECRLLEFKMY